MCVKELNLKRMIRERERESACVCVKKLNLKRMSWEIKRRRRRCVRLACGAKFMKTNYTRLVVLYPAYLFFYYLLFIF